MNQYTGTVARATAGHDKGGLFFVMAQEGEYLFLANGRQRKMGEPKRKKLRHVVLSSTKYPLPHSDKGIRRALFALEKEGITLGKR